MQVQGRRGGDREILQILNGGEGGRDVPGVMGKIVVYGGRGRCKGQYGGSMMGCLQVETCRNKLCQIKELYKKKGTHPHIEGMGRAPIPVKLPTRKTNTCKC